MAGMSSLSLSSAKAAHVQTLPVARARAKDILIFIVSLLKTTQELDQDPFDRKPSRAVHRPDGNEHVRQLSHHKMDSEWSIPADQERKHTSSTTSPSSHWGARTHYRNGHLPKSTDVHPRPPSKGSATLVQYGRSCRPRQGNFVVVVCV